MTDITAVSDISAVNHQSSDAEKYKILTASQSFDRKYEFPQTQFGMKSNGKPHMCSFSNKEAIWLYAELFLGHHDGSCHGLW